MKNSSSAELKKLQGQLRKMREDRRNLIQERRRQDSAIETLEGQITKLKARQAGGLIITEHAILRYLERVESLDLDDIRDRILPLDVRKKIKALSGIDGTYPCKDGFSVRIQNKAVVTVMTKD